MLSRVPSQLAFSLSSLVYHADQRDVVCLRITRLYLAPHFETVLRIEQHQSDIGHLERREKAAAEVVGTGSVYDVQALWFMNSV